MSATNGRRPTCRASPGCLFPDRASAASAAASSPARWPICSAGASLLPRWPCSRWPEGSSSRSRCRASAVSSAPDGFVASARQMLAHLAQPAAPCDLCRRLRRAVQLHRHLHLCQLSPRRAALLLHADAAWARCSPPISAAVWWCRGSGAPSPCSAAAASCSASSRCGRPARSCCSPRRSPVIVIGLTLCATCGLIVPGGFHRLRHHHRQGGTLGGRRALRLELLYRRQRRRLSRRFCLGRRRLDRLRRRHRRQPGDHGGDRRHRVGAIARVIESRECKGGDEELIIRARMPARLVAG